MATAPVWTMKAGDRLPKLRMVLKDSAGAPLNLGAATVTLRARARGRAGLLALTGTASVVDSIAGVVEYAPGAAEPWVVGGVGGVYDLEWVLNFAGSLQTIPTSGYVTLVVEPALA